MKLYSPKISVNILYENDNHVKSFQIETATMDTAPLIENIQNKLPQATLADFHREIILAYLNKNNGNRTRTAKDLGMSIRALRDNLHRFEFDGFTIPAHKNAEK